MAANSVELRCPAQLSAEGQYRTKQATYRLPGVCNEQVLPPEGKVCSGLHGDMQRLAEMTNPAYGCNRYDGEIDWLGR
jgi:hypothetical protein